MKKVGVSILKLGPLSAKPLGNLIVYSINSSKYYQRLQLRNSNVLFVYVQMQVSPARLITPTLKDVKTGRFPSPQECTPGRPAATSAARSRAAPPGPSARSTAPADATPWRVMSLDSDPVIWDTQLYPETKSVEKVGGFQQLFLIS